jgi:hypothetical protein
MTRWAKVTAFTGKGQQLFMTAVFALDPVKAIKEIATIQIPLHNLSDMGAKKAVYSFKNDLHKLAPGFQGGLQHIDSKGSVWDSEDGIRVSAQACVWRVHILCHSTLALIYKLITGECGFILKIKAKWLYSY